MRWWPGIALSVYLLSSAYWARAVSDVLRRAGFLRWTLFLGTLALVVGFLKECWRNEPSFSRRRLSALGIIAGVYAGFFYGPLKVLEEWIHFLQIGLLVYLFYRPLLSRGTSRAAPWQAAALAGLVGTAEEALQIFVPWRYFDWRDIGFNWIAALLAAALIAFVLQGTTRVPSVSS